jgi:hypothetical protein
MVLRTPGKIQKIVTVTVAVLPMAPHLVTIRGLGPPFQSVAKKSGSEQPNWLRNAARSRSN